MEMLASLARISAKETLGDLAATLKTFRRKPHRFRFAHRVVDEALLIQTTHYVEVKPFPRAATVKAEGCKQGENGVFDLRLVVGHVGSPKKQMTQCAS